jgi:hypothetical protein
MDFIKKHFRKLDKRKKENSMSTASVPLGQVIYVGRKTATITPKSRQLDQAAKTLAEELGGVTVTDCHNHQLLSFIREVARRPSEDVFVMTGVYGDACRSVLPIDARRQKIVREFNPIREAGEKSTLMSHRFGTILSALDQAQARAMTYLIQVGKRRHEFKDYSHRGLPLSFPGILPPH